MTCLVNVVSVCLLSGLSYFWLKAPMGFVTSVRPSFRVSALVSVAPTGQSFVKFGTGTFQGNLSRNYRFGPNPTTIWEILREYLSTFIAYC